MALAPGIRLGPYEIAAQIGVGGMGEVYQATDTNLARRVAIKVLPEAVASDAERLARFDREAKTLAALNHPNIAAIYGLEKSDGTIALVMELVEGPTLAELIAGRARAPAAVATSEAEEQRTRGGGVPRALNIEEALSIARQIAEALEAAHEAGIIHRDLKPANVKVRPDGTVKVLDFGLAKAMEPASALRASAGQARESMSPTITTPAMTQAGMILGTAAYMSPEQARGKPVDKRADIWAFGCVLYEMLTGKRTFDAEDVSLTLAEVMKSEPDFDALPHHTPGGVRQALKLCLQKDPRQRGGDIAAIRLALEGAFETAGAPVEASAVAGPAVPAWRLPAWPILAAVVAVAAVAGTAGWLFKPSPPPQIVSFDQELPNGTSFFSAGYSSIAVSPDGRRVAYSTTDGVYLRLVDQLEPRLIPGTRPAENAVSDIMFSPDGEWIGYASSSALQLQKLSVNGGVPVTLAAVTTAYAGGTWTADNDMLFAQGQAVMRVSADGGTPETLFEVTEGIPLFPRMLPGGGNVSYTVASPAGGRTIVRALDGDGAETSFPGARAEYLPTGHVVYFLQGSLFAQPFDLASHRPSGGPVPLVEGVMNSGVAQFAVSPSGALAYIPGGAVGASAQVAPAIVSADGRVQSLDGIPPGPYSSPRVSPDGTRVALQTTEGSAPFNALTSRIWVYDLSGDTALRPLTQEGKSFHPIWTPDSQRLTYYSDRDGAPGLYWQAADGTEVPERLTMAEEGMEHWPDAWSPDGRTLAYQIISPSSGMVDLWVLDLDELDAPGERRPLFARPERQHGAAFSPNGRWIAYGSTEGSPNAEQIYVEPFPSTGEKHQLTRESGAFPIWSPDGRSLFYRRNAQSTAGEEVTEFAQVDIVDGETFRWRNERRVPVGSFQIFGGLRDYDVLPDGRFLMLFRGDRSESGEAERLRIDVVLNWVEELKARVPVN